MSRKLTGEISKNIERNVPLSRECEERCNWPRASQKSLGEPKAENEDIESGATELSPIRALLEEELRLMRLQMKEKEKEKPELGKRTRDKASVEVNEGVRNNQASGETNSIFKEEADKINMSSERESSTPTMSGTTSPFADPLMNTTGSNKATTTERRTTTTTTTKRVIKSSDDFIPTASDIQQLRSESRTSSISSSSPLFNTAGSQLQQQRDREQQQQQQQQSSSTSTTTTTTTTKQGGSSNSKSWGDGIQSPFIQDTEEGRVLKLRFDVTQYEPDEIVVKTVDNRLTVHAKHEEKSENRTVYREYNREFHLPDGTDVEQIKSSLSKDGVLTVDCPLPSPQLHGASRRIPIERV